MARLLLEHGVPSGQILQESESTSTLESVINCARIIRQEESPPVFVCSDRYHIPRCRFLFGLLGIRARGATMPSGRRANGTPRWLFYCLRESVAVVVDAMLALRWRLLESD